MSGPKVGADTGGSTLALRTNAPAVYPPATETVAVAVVQVPQPAPFGSSGARVAERRRDADRSAADDRAACAHQPPARDAATDDASAGESRAVTPDATTERVPELSPPRVLTPPPVPKLRPLCRLRTGGFSHQNKGGQGRDYLSGSGRGLGLAG
jgi:hypothetical protein